MPLFVFALKKLLAVLTINFEWYDDKLIINWMGCGRKSDLIPCPGRPDENYEVLQNDWSVGEDSNP